MHSLEGKILRGRIEEVGIFLQVVLCRLVEHPGLACALGLNNAPALSLRYVVRGRQCPERKAAKAIPVQVGVALTALLGIHTSILNEISQAPLSAGGGHRFCVPPTPVRETEQLRQEIERGK